MSLHLGKFDAYKWSLGVIVCIQVRKTVIVRADILVLVGALVATGRVASSLMRLRQYSEKINAEWRTEYNMRVCGRLQAAQANLADAAKSIAGYMPARSNELIQRASDFSDRVYGHYPAAADCSDLINHSLNIELHRQGKSPQEAIGNWVATYTLDQSHEVQ